MKVRLELWRRTVDGIPCPFPVGRLRVRDQYGAFAELDFRVDSQADFTTIPIATAEREKIPFSREHPRTAIGLVGETATFRDRIHLVIAGRDHDWPCEFINVPPPRAAGPQRQDLLPALGRAGFLDEYAISVDSGYLILTRLGPLRRWWHRRLHAVWHALGLIHPPDKPL